MPWVTLDQLKCIEQRASQLYAREQHGVTYVPWSELNGQLRKQYERIARVELDAESEQPLA